VLPLVTGVVSVTSDLTQSQLLRRCVKRDFRILQNVKGLLPRGFFLKSLGATLRRHHDLGTEPGATLIAIIVDRSRPTTARWRE
jgi:hypothetical protein